MHVCGEEAEQDPLSHSLLGVICQGKESVICEGAGTKLCSALPAGLSSLHLSIWWILGGLEESPLLPGAGRLRERDVLVTSLSESQETLSPLISQMRNKAQIRGV